MALIGGDRTMPPTARQRRCGTSTRMVTGTATLVEQVVDFWEPAGFTDNGLDCDDAAASIHPGADEPVQRHR